MEEEKINQPRGHVFDEIYEYDNDMPVWWVNLFWITIIYAGAYLAWFHVPGFPGGGLIAEYEVASQRLDLAKQRAEEAARAKGFDFKVAAKDPDYVAEGKATYLATCAACHGPEGQGLIGPNLTDNFWVHGKSFAKLEQVVLKGVLEKGMPPWQDALGLAKVRQVLTFIATLQGTAPPNPKEAQGEAGTLE
jgi:cytochrome c oxidase cbb3-type subunit 3